MTSEGNYNFLAVRMLAKDIVDKIGPNIFYSDTNNIHTTAPSCKLLRSVNAFEEYVLNCFKQSGNIIQLHNLRHDMGAGIYGMYIRKSNDHYILINSKLNICWNRFTRLKELCSVYVDHYQYNSNPTDYLTSLDNAFSQKTALNSSSGLDYGDLDSETFAILLACELMIPIYERQSIADYFQFIKDDKLTYNDLAKSLLMPEYFLRMYNDKGLINEPPLYTDFN